MPGHELGNPLRPANQDEILEHDHSIQVDIPTLEVSSTESDQLLLAAVELLALSINCSREAALDLILHTERGSNS